MSNTSENIHFVCSGTCGGVDDHAHTCEAQECTMFGEPLVACECGDGEHDAADEEQQLEADIEEASGE